MLVRNRTWRSSSSLATALARLGRREEPAVAPVPLQLAHALPTEGPGEDVMLGVKTPSEVTSQRLVVWERLESDGDYHTVYLRGDLVESPQRATPEASIRLRPRAPGHYKVIDDANGQLLHYFHVGATTGPG